MNLFLAVAKKMQSSLLSNNGLGVSGWESIGHVHCHVIPETELHVVMNGVDGETSLRRSSRSTSCHELRQQALCYRALLEGQHSESELGREFPIPPARTWPMTTYCALGPDGVDRSRSIVSNDLGQLSLSRATHIVLPLLRTRRR